MDRVLKAWGIDGHNSHTNVCSASARLGLRALVAATTGPAPTTRTRASSCCSPSHLEAGHYFNPHAQRIIEGKLAGAKLAVMDPRLSNTASMADYWLPTYPGSEAAVLLAMAQRHPRRGPGRPRVRRDAGRTGASTWPTRHPGDEPTFAALPGRAAASTTASSRRSSRRRRAACPRDRIVEVARLIGPRARRLRLARLARHRQRQPGRLAGRARAAAPDRAHGERGHARAAPRPTPGTSTSPSSGRSRPAQKEWNELLFPQRVAAQPLRDVVPAAALPQGRAGQARRRTSRASTTRSGRTPTA